MIPANRPHLKHWPRRLPQSLEVPETTLWFNLEVSAARFPRKAALVFFGRSLSYAELKAQAERMAGWLQAQGVRKGERVALYLQNCPQYVVAFYAVMRLGAVVVPVNPMNRVEEFGHYITDPDTRLVVCSAEGAAVVQQANAALPAAQQLKAILVTRYADVLPEVIAPELAPSPALEARAAA